MLQFRPRNTALTPGWRRDLDARLHQDDAQREPNDLSRYERPRDEPDDFRHRMLANVADVDGAIYNPHITRRALAYIKPYKWGVAFALLTAGSAYAIAGLAGPLPGLPAPAAIGALAESAFVPASTGLAVIFLLFPSGGLPSPRWRPAAVAGLALIGVTLAAFVISPRQVALPATVPPLSLPCASAGPAERQLIEWNGAQRWCRGGWAAHEVRTAAAAAGGHAILVRAADKSAGAFTRAAAPLMRIHRELKLAFDPDRIFNAGRLYADL